MSQEATPNKESSGGGTSEKQLVQWVQKQLNRLEGELKSIESRLSSIDKTSAVMEERSKHIHEKIDNLHRELKELKAENKEIIGSINKLNTTIAKYAGGLIVIVSLVGLVMAGLRFISI